MFKLPKLHLLLNNSLVPVSLRANHSGGRWSNHPGPCGSSAWIQASVPRQAGVSPQSALEHNPARNMTLSQAHNRNRSELLTQSTAAPLRKLCVFVWGGRMCLVAGTERPVCVSIISYSFTHHTLKWPLLITYQRTEQPGRCSLVDPCLRGASRVETDSVFLTHTKI